MSRLVLGINAAHGDASAALVDERGLVAAVAEERINRRKHSGGFPRLAVLEVLRLAGARATDLTDVAVARDPVANLAAKVAHLARHPVVNAPLAWTRLRVHREVASSIALVAEAAGVSPHRLKARFHQVEHHLAHVASAFYTSPFERATGFTADASGDFVTSMTAACAGTRIEPRRRLLWPHSLGVFYTALCQFIGYGGFGDEHKVMGLAAYGVNGFAPEMREILHLHGGPGGREIRLDLQFFRHHRIAEGMIEQSGGEVQIPQLWEDTLVGLFGPPRRAGDPLTDRDRDLAASLQIRFEEAYLALVERAVLDVGSRDVVVAGGSALNAVGNGRLLTERLVDRAYFHPAASDDGTAAGAALHVYHAVHGGPRAAPLRHAYLGSAWTDARIEEALVAAGLPHLRLGPDRLVARAAGALHQGKIVGWFQGREEWGPRALGNRSILCHPGWPGMKATLNARAKNREPFRPFAPSVHAEKLSTCFHGAHEVPFMSAVYKVRAEWKDRLSAVTHEDGTARVQTVRREDNALYYDLIADFEQRTGIPVLLNTSFNENEPIVHTPAQAIDCFARTRIDALGIGSFWLEKAEGSMDITPPAPQDEPGMNPDAPGPAGHHGGPGLHPSIVLSAYLEPLVRGRRVAILGDATIGLADELSHRGARLLHVYDPDSARVAEALARAAPGRPHQVAYAVLAGDLGVRDGAFDVVIVPDLSLFADPADAMRRARRLVPSSGVAVFVAPNAAVAGRSLLRGHDDTRSALGYYELFDLVSLQFAKVRMIGQAPFVGYTVADFAPDGEPEISVDTSLLASSEEPEHFLAIASDRPVALEAYAVIELPWRDVADAADAADAAIHTTRTTEKHLLAEAEARATVLTAEIAALREREIALAATVRAAEDRAIGAAARVVELEVEVEGRVGKLRELEARAGDSHVRAERLANQIRDMEEELARQRDRGTKLSKLLDDEKRARTKAEVELGMVRGSPEIAGAKDRIDALSAELDAARARIGELEADQPHTTRHPASPPLDERHQNRLDELEQAVNAALREAADAAGERDAAHDRAEKAEALLARAAVVEAQLAAERRDRAELDARASAAEARTAEAARRLAEAELVFAEGQQRSVEAARRADEIAQRLAEAQRRVADAAPVVAEQRARLAEQQARLTEQQARLIEQQERITEQQGRLTTLETELAAARLRAADADRDRATAEDVGAATAEITSLEGALRERGHTVASLTRDLRESERVGKELLGELEGLHAWISNGSSLAPAEGDLQAAATPTAPTSEDLRGRLDALAASAARSEADLQAAAWRIAQLERELTEARRDALAAGEPTSVQVELEQALAAARDEVATLRRALGGGAS